MVSESAGLGFRGGREDGERPLDPSVASTSRLPDVSAQACACLPRASSQIGPSLGVRGAQPSKHKRGERSLYTQPKASGASLLRSVRATAGLLEPRMGAA